MSVQPILANAAVSISDFKKSPNAALKEANGEPVAVLTNGRISGYYVSPGNMGGAGRLSGRYRTRQNCPFPDEGETCEGRSG
ncbi:hypothetical protein PEC301889_23370 [Pectobacterium carotovorum subsp. carotovorum]|nr:hypothetical protein PEC301889_23370 [Pectobacterium carotovorum subsp. carotovorum]